MFFFGYPYPPDGNMQQQGVYLKYMPLFAFLATHKISKIKIFNHQNIVLFYI